MEIPSDSNASVRGDCILSYPYTSQFSCLKYRASADIPMPPIPKKNTFLCPKLPFKIDNFPTIKVRCRIGLECLYLFTLKLHSIILGRKETGSHFRNINNKYWKMGSRKISTAYYRAAMSYMNLFFMLPESHNLKVTFLCTTRNVV